MRNNLVAVLLVTMAALTGLSIATADGVGTVEDSNVSETTRNLVNQPGNLMRQMAAMIAANEASSIFRATVVSLTPSTITVQRTGHDAETAPYAVIDSFPYPAVDDEVIVQRIGSGFIVIGKVLRSGLVERYLTIETELRILPSGKITWGSDGQNFIDDDIIQWKVIDVLDIAGLRAVDSADIEFYAHTIQANVSGRFVNFTVTDPDSLESVQINMEAKSPTGSITKIHLFATGPGGSGGFLEVYSRASASHPAAAILGSRGLDVVIVEPVGDGFHSRVTVATFALGTRTANAGPDTDTIAAGVITAHSSFMTVDTEAAGPTDNLDNIVAPSGGALVAGQEIKLKPVDSARTIVVRAGVGGNIILNVAGNFTMDNANDMIKLTFDGTNWLEDYRSNNGA